MKYCNRWCWHERYIVKDEWFTAIAGQVYRSWLILMKCLYCKLLNLHLFMHYNEEHRAMIHNWLNMCITCVIYNLEQSHTCLIHLCLFAFYLDRIIYLFIGFQVCTSNNCLYWYVHVYFANSLLINLTVYSWPPVNLQLLFLAFIDAGLLINYVGLLILLQH